MNALILTLLILTTPLAHAMNWSRVCQHFIAEDPQQFEQWSNQDVFEIYLKHAVRALWTGRRDPLLALMSRQLRFNEKYVEALTPEQTRALETFKEYEGDNE